MIEIRKVQTTDGHRIDHFVESDSQVAIEAQDLMLFPALINPHVHFRVPGEKHKEDWEAGARAAIAGGVTTVFGMPNNDPPCTNIERLKEKNRLIEMQIAKASIPLRYRLFLGADADHLHELPKIKDSIAGLKIYMGSSTSSLSMSDRGALEEAFRIAGECKILVAVHAENSDPSVTSRSIALAIELAKKYKTQLYIVHVSSGEELDLIRAAKKEGLPIYAEAAPHHLFLSDSAYAHLGTKALVTPPLRNAKECEMLWEAIHDETIDTIGTDHASHTIEEKKRPDGSAPSGFPSIELYFPLFLNAYHEKKLSLEQIVSLTHTRPQEIFNLPLNEDIVLVDMNKKRQVEDAHLHPKAKWSPYAGWTLQGWPCYTILGGKLFDLEKL